MVQQQNGAGGSGIAGAMLCMERLDCASEGRMHGMIISIQSS